MLINLETIDGLPETLKGAVKEADGKHTLDLSGLMPTEDLTGLKTALQNERQNNSAYSKYGKPSDIDAKIAELTEKAKGNGKGAEDAQAKLDAMVKDYDTKLADRDTRITQMMQRNALAEFKTELAKAGFIPEAIDDIASSGMGRLQFNDDGTPKVLTADGKPMIGSGADHGATLADLAKELAASKPYAVRDGGKGGSGKQPNANGGTPTLKRSQMNAKQKADYQAEHGQAAFLQLPK